jgi:hypothetical protein
MKADYAKVKPDDYTRGVYLGYLYNEAGDAIALVEVQGSPGVYPDHVEYRGRIYERFNAPMRGWRLVIPRKARIYPAFFLPSETSGSGEKTQP